MRTITSLFVAVQVLLPSLASAQGGLREVPDPKPPYRGIYGGINFSLAVPTGEFDQNVGTSPGVGLNLVIPFAASGQIGVLINTGLLIYGSRSRNIPLSGTGGLVSVRLTTTNYLTFIGGGLQYARRTGAFRPYLNGTIGGSYLATETSVAGSNDEGPFASTTNLSDWVWAATAGGGMYIPLKKGKLVSLDLGAQFNWGGKADYLTKSGIIDNGDGTTTLNPSTSRTDFWRIVVGFEFGI